MKLIIRINIWSHLTVEILEKTLLTFTVDFKPRFYHRGRKPVLLNLSALVPV